MILYTLITIIIFSVAWATLFPQEAMAVIAEFKRQLRLRVIRRSGTEGAKQLALALHQFAREQGIEAEIVDEVLAEHHDRIVERVGRHYADEILGEADPTERYF
jgi:hypothetical protein